MRRRKKEKHVGSESSVPPISEESPEFSVRGRMIIKQANAAGASSGTKGSSDTAVTTATASAGKVPSLLAAKSRSPALQRKRSLLGLSSMRDLVEQVQDSLTKNKQEAVSASSVPGTQAVSDKSRSKGSAVGGGDSRGGGAGGSKSSAPSAPGSPPASAAATCGGEGHGAVVRASPPVKKKVLDIKLLPMGTSLTLRTKKQAQFTPSPSEFKTRERADVKDVLQPFCGVCASPFTLMVRRQRCQVCAESVCAQCSTDRRYVEGQKGLQRVCDICIVEGPVVLDENGMYAVGPSPATTPIVAPHRHAPASVVGPVPLLQPTLQASSVPSLAAGVAADGAVPPVSRTLVTTPLSRREGSSGSAHTVPLARTLFTESSPRRSPSISSSSGGSRSRGRGNGHDGHGHGSGDANGGRRRGGESNAGRVDCETSFTTSSATGGANWASLGYADTATVAASACLGDDDEADAEEQGGTPQVTAPARVRKRGKKARRAACAADARTSSDRRLIFGDCVGAGSSSSNGNGSFFSSASGAGPSPALGPCTSTGGGSTDGAAGGTSTVIVGAVSNSATRRWESTGKKQSSSAEAKRGPRLAIDQGGGFVRDFVRGAGIHRLDPRRLAGPIMACTAWTRLDRAWGYIYGLVLKMLETWYYPGRNNSHGRNHYGRHSNAGSRGRGGGAGSGGYSNSSSYWSSSGSTSGTGSGSGGSRRGGRWRPGWRTCIVSALILVASYRRSQVTHPEMTAAHALGVVSSLLFELAGFLALAVVGLAVDACGAVLPAVCGIRNARPGGDGVGEERDFKQYRDRDEVGGSGVLAAAVAAGLDEASRMGRDGSDLEENDEGNKLDKYFFL